MPARLIFVHGTTVRDVSNSMGEIRRRASKHLGLRDGDVVAAEWGREIGPPRRNFIPALPPEYSMRAIGDDTEITEAEFWALLLSDPSVELRILTGERASQTSNHEVGEGASDFDLGVASPTEAITARLEAMVPPEEALANAGIGAPIFEQAKRELLEDDATIGALETATRSGDAAAGDESETDPELNEALANSLVARTLRLATPQVWGTEDEGASAWTEDDPAQIFPAAAVDADVRTALVDAVYADLGSSTRGLSLLKSWGGKLATRVAVSKRADIMNPLAHFLHDVTFYLANRKPIQDVITDRITEAGDSRPVVVVAHSLGGIAAVDLLSKDDPPHVDLLVTVGSQAPLLYLMDALETLSPGNAATRKPHVPWLNIYNPEDLLSFCAKTVFDNVDNDGIEDFRIDAGVPFPASHSAYWRVDAVFQAIERWISSLEVPVAGQASKQA